MKIVVSYPIASNSAEIGLESTSLNIQPNISSILGTMSNLLASKI